jgi:hypothetical protein
MPRPLPLLLLLCLALPALAGKPAPAPAPKPPRFTWPNPDVLEELEVPGIVQARGVPMKLRAIRVRRHAQEMVDLYLDAFARSGLYVPPPKHQPQLTRELTLTGLDTERLIAYTVIVQPNPDGTTSLMLGESNLALLGKTASSGQDPAPLFPGAQGVMRTDQEGAQVLVFRAKAKPEEVQSFYREVLGRSGFIEPEPALQPGVFARKGEQLQLTVHPREGGEVSVALIHRVAPAEAEPGAPTR